MGKMSLKMWLKISIAQIAWKLFIWGSNTTEEIYWELIYNIERERKLSEQQSNCNKPAVSNNAVPLVCETCAHVDRPNNAYPCCICYEDYSMYEQTNDC